MIDELKSSDDSKDNTDYIKFKIIIEKSIREVFFFGLKLINKLIL